MNTKQLTKLSKFLSLVLRHKPQEIGLTLDKNGWAKTQELLSAMHTHGQQIDLETLKHLVETNNKKRFVFSSDFEKIRANQGHSLNIELNLSPQIPPTSLFHGTATRFLDAILTEGLSKRDRQHVHLSKDLETAITVGKRHGSPIVLKVNTVQMLQDGYIFFLSENGVWLTDHVPTQYLEKFPHQDQ